jgi:low temperature requirement protein LtrA
MAGETLKTFREWFWRPPRPHGATIHDRVVSNLELFYDLVYVAVISQAALHLADDVSARAVVEFAIVFALVWFAWVNGSLYLELHGRQDGRTRATVFAQMGILALLTVFTADATGSDGVAFAVVYALLLAVMGWQWFSVLAQDEPEFRRTTTIYVVGMGISVAVMLSSTLLPDDMRLIVWAGFSVAWTLALIGFGRFPDFGVAFTPTHSLIERFDLFTIIVLGEVVFGVVDGLAHAQRDALTIATGLLALFVGFGFWWSYFDIVGRRLPRAGGPVMVRWFLSHLPMTMAIAAAGAAMTSLIVHAHDPVVPSATGWLIAGAVAVGLLMLVVAALTLADARRLPAVYRKIALTMGAGAVAALLVGALPVQAWQLALLLTLILGIVWLVAITRFLRAGAWSEAQAEAEAEVARATERGGTDIRAVNRGPID